MFIDTMTFFMIDLLVFKNINANVSSALWNHINELIFIMHVVGKKDLPGYLYMQSFSLFSDCTAYRWAFQKLSASV